MASQVHQKFTGDEKDMARAYDKLTKKNELLRKEVQKVKREAREAKRAFKDSFGGQATQRLKTFTAGLIGTGGVLLAYRAIRKELELVRRVQETAFQTQVSVLAARARLAQNLAGAGGGDPARQAAIDERGRQAGISISRETGLSQAIIFPTLGSAVSAAGQRLEPAIKAVRQASISLAETPELIEDFSGALIGISKAAQDITGPKFDPEVAQGLVQKAGGLSRVKDPLKQAQNLPVGIIGGQLAGFSIQESISFLAAISNATEDIQGRKSATANISFPAAITAFFEENKKAKKLEEEIFGTQKFRDARKVVAATQLALTGGTELDTRRVTAGERTAILQDPANAKLRETFIKETSFQVKTGEAIKALLRDPRSVPAREFAEFQKQIGTTETLRASTQQFIAGRLEDPLFKTGRAGRQVAAGLEQLQVADVPSARGDIARRAVIGTLEATGLTDVEVKANVADFEIQTRGGQVDPFGKAAEILGRRQERLLDPSDIQLRGETSEKPLFVAGGGGAAIPPSAARVRRDPTEVERSFAETVGSMITALNENTAAQKIANEQRPQNTAAVEGNTQTTVNVSQGGGKRSTAPAALPQESISE